MGTYIPRKPSQVTKEIGPFVTHASTERTVRYSIVLLRNERRSQVHEFAEVWVAVQATRSSIGASIQNRIIKEVRATLELFIWYA